MSDKRKKEIFEDVQAEMESDSDETSSSSEDESIEDEKIDQIETEFEAYPPLTEDKEGIKALLKQLFKKEPIELGQLTDHLINEKNLCTVVKQLVDEEVEDEDEDVFSLSALIQLNKKELIDKPFIKLITNFLIRTAKESDNKQIVQILEDTNQTKALVLNERFINLPTKLGVMSLQNLLDEAKNQNLKIDYFIFICKLLKAKDESSSVKKKNHKRSKATDENDLIYLNGEDEVFAKNALEKYEFKIDDDQTDLTVNQNWKSGQQFIPFRKVLLLNQNALNSSLKELKGAE